MTNVQPEFARIFVVGCPRSGTTLLQGLLARHARVTTFPETHFFAVCFGSRNPLLGGINGRRALRRATRASSLSVPRPHGPAALFSPAPYVAAFLRALDERTVADDQAGWLEKTPRHVFFIEEIRRWVPSAQVVHLLRDGRATVASLFDVAQRHPDGVWRRYRSLDYCIERWNRSVEASQRWLGQPGHHLLRYEEIARDSTSAIRGLCAATKLTFLAEARELAEVPAFYRPHETWKPSASLAVYDYGLAKYEQLFNASQRRRIEAGLGHVPELDPVP